MDESVAIAAIRQVIIVNQRGLHARAAAKFVKLADCFEATIWVRKLDDACAEEIVAGTSIMGLMMLAAAKGSQLELRASGPAAHAALSALAKLVADRFDEEE